MNDQIQPPQPAPEQPVALPAQVKPATPAQFSLPAQVKPTALPPQTALPKSQTKTNRRFVLGCVTAFGCSIFLFLGVLFAFLLFGSPDNPIFKFLGVAPGEVVNVLITLVNLIFLILVFVSFIFVVIGIFRITTAKKEDKEAKRKGTMFTVISVAVLVFLIFIWIFAYFFLAQKQTPTIKAAIITTPAVTTNLTAPIEIKFDASKAPINTSQFSILSYDWDFADGTKVKGPIQSHTFTDVGIFTAKLAITVTEKTTGKDQVVEFTKDVSIANVLADVVIKATPKKGEAPLAVKLDGSNSTSKNGEITAYNWDINGDGVFGDSKEASGETTFDKPGTYKVKLQITDSTGAISTGEMEIEVTPADLPQAVINVEGTDGTELETGKAYIFSGASSTTPVGTIEKYEWQFGDGGKASTRTATHSFKDAGSYDIVLTVTNSSKKEGEMTQRFNVTPQKAAPIVSLQTTPLASNGVIDGQAPFTVVFDASGSKDPNDNIVDYAWDFNDDEKTDDANAVTSYTFAKTGTYNVTLTVTDATNLSTKEQVVVKVASPGLKADINADPTAGVVPLTVAFDATGSSYSDGKIVSHEWDFGDDTGKRIDTAKVSHRYSKIGTFTATVTVIGSDNKRAATQVVINVRPLSLQACFSTSIPGGKAPLTVQFDPTCSTGTVIKYSWDFAKLGNSADRKPTFTFKDAGKYPVTLEVTDTQNTIDTYTLTITVE